MLYHCQWYGVQYCKSKICTLQPSRVTFYPISPHAVLDAGNRLLRDLSVGYDRQSVISAKPIEMLFNTLGSPHCHDWTKLPVRIMQMIEHADQTLCNYLLMVPAYGGKSLSNGTGSGRYWSTSAADGTAQQRAGNVDAVIRGGSTQTWLCMFS